MTYGSLAIDTLNTSTGVLATQNGMTGIAKAWVSFNGTGGVIYGSGFNVSSVTVSATGCFLINLTTAMSNINYAVVANASPNGTNAAYGVNIMSNSAWTVLTPTTTQFGIITPYFNTTPTAFTYTSVVVYGN